MCTMQVLWYVRKFDQKQYTFKQDSIQETLGDVLENPCPNRANPPKKTRTMPSKWIDSSVFVWLVSSLAEDGIPRSSKNLAGRSWQLFSRNNAGQFMRYLSYITNSSQGWGTEQKITQRSFGDLFFLQQKLKTTHVKTRILMNMFRWFGSNRKNNKKVIPDIFRMLIYHQPAVI